MKSTILIFSALLLVVGATACKQDAATPPNTTPPSTTPPAQPPVVDQEPASHEKPAKVTDENLKVGKCYKVSQDKNIWQFVSKDDMFSPKPTDLCDSSYVQSHECSDPGFGCKLPSGDFLSCKGGQTQFKCYGWVYEKTGRDYQPLEGVSLDIFWFAGCMAGSCKPMVPAVLTDKYGYFEIFTTTLLDTLRINGKEGYYGVCNQNKPMSGGGTYVTADPNAATGALDKPFRDAFKQMKIKPESCK